MIRVTGRKEGFLNPEAALELKEVAARIACALAAGMVLGLERESHGRAAGLKTTILACVASCLAMILSENFYLETANPGAGILRPDRARLAAGILTGIGFLGAGAIIRQGALVRGVTTAAVLWFITILGLAFGSGHLILGAVGTGIAMFALFVLPYLEQFIKKDLYASITVTMRMDGIGDAEILKRFKDAGVRVHRATMDHDLRNETRILQYDLKVRNKEIFEVSRLLVERLSECRGVSRVKWN